MKEYFYVFLGFNNILIMEYKNLCIDILMLLICKDL